MNETKVILLEEKNENKFSGHIVCNSFHFIDK